MCVCLVRVSHFLSLSFFLSLFTWFSLLCVALHSTPNRAKKIKRKKIAKKSKNNWEYCTRELTETCKVEDTVNNGMSYGIKQFHKRWHCPLLIPLSSLPLGVSTSSHNFLKTISIGFFSKILEINRICYSLFREIPFFC